MEALDPLPPFPWSILPATNPTHAVRSPTPDLPGPPPAPIPCRNRPPSPLRLFPAPAPGPQGGADHSVANTAIRSYSATAQAPPSPAPGNQYCSVALTWHLRGMLKKVRMAVIEIRRFPERA